MSNISEHTGVKNIKAGCNTDSCRTQQTRSTVESSQTYPSSWKAWLIRKTSVLIRSGQKRCSTNCYCFKNCSNDPNLRQLNSCQTNKNISFLSRDNFLIVSASYAHVTKRISTRTLIDKLGPYFVLTLTHSSLITHHSSPTSPPLRVFPQMPQISCLRPPANLNLRDCRVIVRD
jgi:hypothetical protein